MKGSYLVHLQIVFTEGQWIHLYLQTLNLHTGHSIL